MSLKHVAVKCFLKISSLKRLSDSVIPIWKRALTTTKILITLTRVLTSKDDLDRDLSSYFTDQAGLQDPSSVGSSMLCFAFCCNPRNRCKKPRRGNVYEADREHLGRVEGGYCYDKISLLENPSEQPRATIFIARVVLHSFWITFEDTVFFN